MKSLVINQHGRLVFPSNAWPRLDFSVFDTVSQLSAAVSRDFEAKAPSASQIVSRLEAGGYPSRYELLRDLGLHAFWVNRFAITMYDKRPTRWRDVPRDRADVFLPLLTPWPGFERSSGTIQHAYQTLPSTWDEEIEQKIFEILFAVFAHVRHDAAELPAIKPTVAEFLADPGSHTFVVSAHEPDWPMYSRDDVINAEADVPELEALLRWAMVLHNQYPWAGSTTRLAAGGEIGDDDFVVLFYPRDDEILDFIMRVRAGHDAGSPHHTARSPLAAPPKAKQPPMAQPVADCPPVEIRKAFSVMPRECVGRQHPAGDQGRGGRRCDQRSGARVHPGVRGRRDRWVRGDAGRPGRRLTDPAAHRRAVADRHPGTGRRDHGGHPHRFRRVRAPVTRLLGRRLPWHHAQPGVEPDRFAVQVGVAHDFQDQRGELGRLAEPAR